MTPPTGTVTVVFDGVTLSTVPLTTPLITSIQVAITRDVTVPATTSNGIHIFHLTYSGDSTHAPARSTAAFTVGSSVATGAVTLTANNLSLVANGSGTTTVSITPVGGYNGRLFWSLALTASSNGSSLPGCYFIPTVPIDGATTTTSPPPRPSPSPSSDCNFDQEQALSLGQRPDSAREPSSKRNHAGKIGISFTRNPTVIVKSTRSKREVRAQSWPRHLRSATCANVPRTVPRGFSGGKVDRGYSDFLANGKSLRPRTSDSRGVLLLQRLTSATQIVTYCTAPL